MPRLKRTRSRPTQSRLPLRWLRRAIRRFACPVAFFAVAALGCRDDVETPTAPAPVPAPATAATTALAFRQVSGGESHGCGVTTDDRAYCWGYNLYGQLGDGTKTNRLTPVAVAGALRFRQVSAGSQHSCGVATDSRAYCWGGNGSGQLGNGSWTLPPPEPILVAGGHRFRQVVAGGNHSCGVIDSDAHVYCWGNNTDAQLGDGTNIWRVTPVAVRGGRALRQISAGRLHTCGVTADFGAYCWGRNREGQVGDGSFTGRRFRPVAVAGGHAFRQVDAGDRHTCGVTTNDRAFCWGDGGHGQLGDGTTSLRFVPRAVAGGRTIRRVSAGGTHTCATTDNNVAYCWGWNLRGELGDGTTATRLVPVAVTGDITFRDVSAGGLLSCGKTAAALAYCWGTNSNGELGDGSTTARLTPVPVADPM